MLFKTGCGGEDLPEQEMFDTGVKIKVAYSIVLQNLVRPQWKALTSEMSKSGRALQYQA